MIDTKEPDPPAYSDSDDLDGDSGSQPTTSEIESPSAPPLPPKLPAPGPDSASTSSSQSWIPWTAAQRVNNEVQAGVRNLVQLVAGTEPGSALGLLPSTIFSASSSASPISPSKAPLPVSSYWTSWTAANTNNEVQASVRDLVRQLVVDIDPAAGSSASQETSTLASGAVAILHSCADACAKHDLSLATILQDKYIEEHSPLYWAIVKQSPTRPNQQPRRPVLSAKHEEAGVEAEAEGLDMLGALLSHSSPMKPSTMSELRLACLSVSDQPSFQRLRLLIPKFSSLSGADRVLLGPSLTSDDIAVEIWSGSNSDGGFAVDMQFSQFHRRLMVSRQVGAEFVVRNRIWRFSLEFADSNWSDGPQSGSWCARLSLQDSSPPTWFDGRLILAEPQGQVEASGESAQSPDTPRQPNIVPMRCNKSYRLEPSYDQCKQIAVSLEDNQAFASLQYAETSYVPMDEKLTLRLEARLIKPSENGPSWNDSIPS